MESARCFCVRNLTRSLRALFRILIRQQHLRKYRTSCTFHAVFYMSLT